MKVADLGDMIVQVDHDYRVCTANKDLKISDMESTIRSLRSEVEYLKGNREGKVNENI